MTRIIYYSALICALVVAADLHSQSIPSSLKYSWPSATAGDESLSKRIATPAGYQRQVVQNGSFAEWLRYIPLRDGNPAVKLFDGSKKGDQSVHHAVIDIEPGTRDLQQCADAVMRLRAEYLFSAKQFDKIHFNFTSGFNCSYVKWSQGFRPKVEGSKVQWVKRAEPDTSYASFRKYLDTVFTYCGTQSLSKELKSKSISDIQPGDVFIRGGFPGHAVLVMDVAVNANTKEKIFLLAQSYMPAQDIHILKNPTDISLSPWYSSKISATLITPEWTFSASELMSFP